MFPCSAWAIAVLPCCKEGGVYNCMHMISWIVKCYVLLWRSFTSFTSFTWCEIWSHWSHNSDVNSETVVVCATITIMCLCFLLWFISDSYQFPWLCNQQSLDYRRVQSVFHGTVMNLPGSGVAHRDEEIDKPIKYRVKSSRKGREKNL